MWLFLLEYWIFDHLTDLDEWIHQHELDHSWLAFKFCQWCQQRFFDLQEQSGMLDDEPTMSREFLYIDDEEDYHPYVVSIEEGAYEIPMSDPRWKKEEPKLDLVKMAAKVMLTFFKGHIDDIGPVKFKVIIDIFNPPWKDWPSEIPYEVKAV